MNTSSDEYMCCYYRYDIIFWQIEINNNYKNKILVSSNDNVCARESAVVDLFVVHLQYKFKRINIPKKYTDRIT